MLSIPLPEGRTIPGLVARALMLGNHQAEFHLGNMGKSLCPQGAPLHKGREEPKHLQSPSFSEDPTILWSRTRGPQVPLSQ